ncbi:hypothetical protein FISHEDRAFT_56229 [Fistulina hepatica ATCC 64428]|uniref:Uncharacterized protein n=1 Tax=Fistulina hepatica ATCC 64428 TaxID=1128425 RepID=A0A0D7AL11_9AGAR|nr:hypothetical protein FISHEDRAFT_56229 [Fistulina hepatica ATCC 64428]
MPVKRWETLSNTMKFISALSVLFYVSCLFSGSTADSNLFKIPAENATLSTNQAFAFNYTSGKYFEESSLGITVLLTPYNWTYSEWGMILVENLEPYTVGISQYTAIVTPNFAGGEQLSTQFQLVVVEKYSVYGGTGDALATDARYVWLD